MPDYKLTYFDVRGYAEFTRYVLAYGKADWQNDLVTFDRWSQLKPTTPMGQIPVLTLKDGRQLCQSRAILRFLAKQFGLVPNNDFDAALADMYVGGIYNDLYPKYIPCYQPYLKGGSLEDCKPIYATFKKESLPASLDLYEQFLSKHSSGWLIGDKVTYADIVVGEFFERLQSCFDADVLKGHPKLAALVKRVGELPGIKEYVANRSHMSF